LKEEFEFGAIPGKAVETKTSEVISDET